METATPSNVSSCSLRRRNLLAVAGSFPSWQAPLRVFDPYFNPYPTAIEPTKLAFLGKALPRYFRGDFGAQRCRFLLKQLQTRRNPRTGILCAPCKLEASIRHAQPHS